MVSRQTIKAVCACWCMHESLGFLKLSSLRLTFNNVFGCIYECVVEYKVQQYMLDHEYLNRLALPSRQCLHTKAAIALYLRVLAFHRARGRSLFTPKIWQKPSAS